MRKRRAGKRRGEPNPVYGGQGYMQEPLDFKTPEFSQMRIQQEQETSYNPYGILSDDSSDSGHNNEKKPSRYQCDKVQPMLLQSTIDIFDGHLQIICFHHKERLSPFV